MNTFICPGTIVKKQKQNRTGEVISIEPKRKIAIVRTQNSFWSESVTNLKVVSYKEVR